MVKKIKPIKIPNDILNLKKKLKWNIKINSQKIKKLFLRVKFLFKKNNFKASKLIELFVEDNRIIN